MACRRRGVLWGANCREGWHGAIATRAVGTADAAAGLWQRGPEEVVELGGRAPVAARRQGQWTVPCSPRDVPPEKGAGVGTELGVLAKGRQRAEEGAVGRMLLNEAGADLEVGYEDLGAGSVASRRRTILPQKQTEVDQANLGSRGPKRAT